MERLAIIALMLSLLGALGLIATTREAPWTLGAPQQRRIVQSSSVNDFLRETPDLLRSHLLASTDDRNDRQKNLETETKEIDGQRRRRVERSTKRRRLGAGAVAGDRINQGHDAPSNKYGYFVALLLSNDSNDTLRIACGGSLLSPLFVLTAAHCVSNLDGRLHFYLHNASIGFFGPEQEDHQHVIQRIRPRHYYLRKEKNHLSPLRLDLAVIELEEPTFDFPTVLPDLGDTIPLELGDHVTAIGLGRVENVTRTSKLQEKRLHFMPTPLCDGWWMTFFRTTSDNGIICTYADFFAGGLCRGDSGSPILKLADDEDDLDTVIGVVSFGYPNDGCTKNVNRTLPDGHAKVSEGRDDLWGPLVCNPPGSIHRRNNASMDDPLPRQLRPWWCDGREFAFGPPPDPVPDILEDFDTLSALNRRESIHERYPYFVGIQYRNNLLRSQRFECMGTLIHPNFVLTMADCVPPKFGNFFEVSTIRVGLNCLLDDNCGKPTYQDRTSVQRIVHPRFHKGGLWEMYNVGLIRLDQPVAIDNFPLLDTRKFFQKTRRNNRNGTKADNTTVWALGIGKASPDIQMESDFLTQFQTTLVKDRSCNRRIKSFFNGKYGAALNATRIPDGLFGCSSRLSVSGLCSSPLWSNPDYLVQWGSPLIVSRNGEQEGKAGNQRKPDVILGTLNFRTDNKCRKRSSRPDVYHRVSAHREWIQCVVCVGSINATTVANLPPGADRLCAGSKPPQQQDCEDKYGISLGIYDDQVLHRRQEEENNNVENVTQQPLPGASKACLIKKRVERRNSTFELNPSTGKTAKCAKIAKNGLASLFCGESQIMTDARKNCAHTCGLCGDDLFHNKTIQ